MSVNSAIFKSPDTCYCLQEIVVHVIPLLQKSHCDDYVLFAKVSMKFFSTKKKVSIIYPESFKNYCSKTRVFHNTFSRMYGKSNFTIDFFKMNENLLFFDIIKVTSLVRAVLLDVFHVRCLEKHFRSLPPNTAPAGYRCYSCDIAVFPRENQAGYVTEQLRNVLSKYNWARVGLCLPLVRRLFCFFV